MRIFPGVLSLVLLSTLTACTNSDEIADTRECLPISADIMNTLAEGSNEFPITPVAAAAVESETRAGLTVIAMSFIDDTDESESEGVWAVKGSPKDYPNIGPWLAVDALADVYSDYPRVINGEELSITEDGADEALSCLANLD